MLYKIARKTWNFVKWIWLVIIITSSTSFVANLFTAKKSDLNDLIVVHILKWLSLLEGLQILILSLCSLFVLITLLAFILKTIDDFSKESKSLKEYLRGIIEENEHFKTIGFSQQSPASLSVNVSLDEIFIHPHFTSDKSFYRPPLSTKRPWRIIQKPAAKTPSVAPLTIEKVLLEMKPEQPAAVVLGIPGSGKSMILQWLALRMARSSLSPYHRLYNGLYPKQLPLLLKVADYAKRLVTEKLSTEDPCLEHFFEKKFVENHSDLLSILQAKLAEGYCLVLFDGVDEINGGVIREQVSEAIFNFISSRNTKNNHRVKRFNRFIITSRILDFQQTAFNSYPHYELCELEDEQIEQFLNCWCPAIERLESKLIYKKGALTSRQKKDANILGTKQRDLLLNVISSDPVIKPLAANPLTLIILASIMRNNRKLPNRRVDLYRVVTHTLLETWNRETKHDSINIELAELLLADLAYHLQGTNFAITEQTVKEITRKVIANFHKSKSYPISDGAIQDLIETLRRSSGLFVEGEWYNLSFKHRTFQEYFAARRLLLEIEHNQAHGITELVTKARRLDEIWREPFLLAAVDKSGEDIKTTNRILKALLAYSPGTNIYNRVHDLVLAIECLIEVKPLTLEPVIERQISLQLLQTYEEAQRSQQFQICDRIETFMLRWLQRLNEEDKHSIVLGALNAVVTDTQHESLRRTTLILLTMLAKHLATCKPVVLNTLIPPLLAVASLPTVGNYIPSPEVATESNPTIANLSAAILSSIGKQGPAGILLAAMREDLERHPEKSRLLVHYSLESQMFLIPTLPPHLEKDFRIYLDALKQWIMLSDNYSMNRTNKQGINLDRAVSIQSSMFNSADEVGYPSTIHLMRLLQLGANSPNETWQQKLQEYLSDQLTSDSYILYQEAALLWVILFPDADGMKKLATIIRGHMDSDNMTIQQYAQHFLAMLGYCIQTLQVIEKQTDLEEIFEQRDLFDRPGLYLSSLIVVLSYLQIFTGAGLDQLDQLALRIPKVIVLRNIQAQLNQQALRVLQLMRFMRAKRDLHIYLALKDVRDTRASHHLLVREDLRDILGLASHLLTYAVIDIQRISDSTLTLYPPSTRFDILLILLGRILWIQKANEIGNAVEQEINRIANIACSGLPHSNNEEAQIRLQIISSLPIRTLSEIALTVQLAEETTDKRIHQACTNAIKNATPMTPEADERLGLFKQSSMSWFVDSLQEIASPTNQPEEAKPERFKSKRQGGVSITRLKAFFSYAQLKGGYINFDNLLCIGSRIRIEVIKTLEIIASFRYFTKNESIFRFLLKKSKSVITRQ